MNISPLFADDWGNLIKVGLVVLAFIGWIIQHVASLNKAPQPQRRKPPLPQPRPPVGPDAGPLDREIDEFLKQAEARRTTPKSQPATPPPPRPVRRKPPPRPALQPTAEVGSAPARPAARALAQESVAEHVQHHLDTRSFNERAEHLTHLDDAGQPLERHVQQVFSHPVGNLAASGTIGQTADSSGATVATLELSAQPTTRAKVHPLAYLLTKGGMRNAVILNEIIVRPEHRW